MLKKDQLGEIIQGPCLEAKGGWKGSVEESSNACKKGIRPDLIRMKDPCKRNEMYLTFSSNRIAVSQTKNWKTYESWSKSWR